VESAAIANLTFVVKPNKPFAWVDINDMQQVISSKKKTPAQRSWCR
jgi:hypothetical protein